jgi:hypothetical protein
MGLFDVLDLFSDFSTSVFISITVWFGQKSTFGADGIDLTQDFLQEKMNFLPAGSLPSITSCIEKVTHSRTSSSVTSLRSDNRYFFQVLLR